MSGTRGPTSAPPAGAPIYRADDPVGMRRAVELLRGGGLVAFPTDTVYGVGVDARLPDAVAELYVAKRRPRDRPIPLLVASLMDAMPFVSTVPDIALPLIEAFWPGGLTLILPITKGVSPLISPGPGVAIRMPDHPVAIDLIRGLGAAIAATSANESGRPDPVDARDVWEQLGSRVDLILDAGRTPGLCASSIVDLTKQPPKLLRAGTVSIERLREYLPELEEQSA